MGLNGDKTSELFCINICCFSTRFYIFLYYSGTLIQVSSKLWMFLISTPHKTRTFTVGLTVTTIYQGNGFAAEVLLGHDHPRVVPVVPLAGELWHFEYFPKTTVRHFEFLIISIFDHVTVIVVRICCCIPNFIKIGSRVRPPDAHNCWMSSAPLLGNEPIWTKQLSVSWNDAFRRIFHFHRWEAVKELICFCGELDFMHRYNLCRWKFLNNIHVNFPYGATLLQYLDKGI